MEFSSTLCNGVWLGLPKYAKSSTERVHREGFHHDFISYNFNLSPKRQWKFERMTREFVSEASRTNNLMDLCRKRSVQCTGGKTLMNLSNNSQIHV